eukprot:CAMPEP_0178684142 /NCGR_PEP_ID=MMETSP0699-20121125/2674_1 /TAXON_ID=265572 /ORGANISM="Extubocellulus spinifer, Strain CCMP396" /LENGTH=247 /DNA_ID=CAMNT_0020328773 /DNA_START=2001 /DNA_END=2744 /DNA_ORIENTATION=-
MDLDDKYRSSNSDNIKILNGTTKGTAAAAATTATQCNENACNANQSAATAGKAKNNKKRRRNRKKRANNNANSSSAATATCSASVDKPVLGDITTKEQQPGGTISRQNSYTSAVIRMFSPTAKTVKSKTIPSSPVVEDVSADDKGKSVVFEEEDAVIEEVKAKEEAVVEEPKEAAHEEEEEEKVVLEMEKAVAKEVEVDIDSTQQANSLIEAVEAEASATAEDEPVDLLVKGENPKAKTCNLFALFC